ncbi:MAG: GNAT family N-acetyltransferase [Actinobacteria bacterium]|nr:GNAT family N-acetyltransferase [Actinomycetota bacterium]
MVEADDGARRIGFIGLGIMGAPMALRLRRAGMPLVVWNRSPDALEPLTAEGAESADTVAELFARCDTVLVMLRDADAVDAVLRGQPQGLAELVRGTTVVNMGTLPPEHSRALADQVEAAGGDYVEAPVSGSRRPAEEGALVAMLAGRPERIAAVQRLIAPLCAQAIPCGEVPQALTMKLTVNVFLISLVTGLAETFHFAERHGVDPELLRTVLDAGQMSSPISRVKTAKLAAGDLTPQAAISDVLMNAQLIVDAARAAGIPSPLLDVCRDLYAAAVARGDGAIDMVGVGRAIGDLRGGDDSRIRFTRATAADIPAITALVRAAYAPYVARIGREPAPMSADYAAQLAAGRILLAHRGAMLVGVLVTEPHPDHLLVENVAVSPDAQGLGIGAQLLDRAEREARGLGLTELRLYTNAKMTENLAYYPRRGYVETGRRTEHGFDRVFFSRTLKE